MAEICCGMIGESGKTSPVKPEVSLRRRLDLVPMLRIVAEAAVTPSPSDASRKRQKKETEEEASKELEPMISNLNCVEEVVDGVAFDVPKFGSTSICGRRRDMEDSVSIHTSFGSDKLDDLHFFGVFDGHGCSHVSTKCKERLHEIVKEEIEASMEAVEWNKMMEKSFCKMDEEISVWSREKKDDGGNDPKAISCKCELQSPQRDAVGSTAVVALVRHAKLVVANCGDSRAVLCRNGVAIPLSSDHKPDRPDELLRIEEAGGRVIYWDGARVLGVLAMSRAIGDAYLKPYVIPEPEVTVTDRTEEDECLILASDGLWDVVSNETACNVARMCLRRAEDKSRDACADGAKEKRDACAEAALLLTKLALARNSTDNVSVVVIDLRRNQLSLAAREELL